jgi:hypothetical protein
VLTGPIEIDKSVELDGSNNLTLDADGEGQVVSVGEGTVVLRGFTLTGSAGADDRAGILNRGDLTLVQSTVRDNDSIGVFNSFSAHLTVVSSTISGNACGGIYQSARSLMMRNSTVSQNGIYEIWEEDGSTTLENSTVSGACAIAVGPENSVTMSNTLVVGACANADFNNDEFSFDTCNLAGANVVSLGHNLESPGDSCSLDPDGTDMVNITEGQLNLEPLADNGGPTTTHALGAGSVAIDQIPAVDCVDADGAPLTTDQRGEPRPETGGTMCDVGAFELQP